MENQLQLSLCSQISTAFIEAMTLAGQANDHAKAAFLKARECGQFLKTAKENLPAGKFVVWIADNTEALGNIKPSRAADWIRLAAIPEDALDSITSTKQAFLALDLLPTQEREPGSQTAHKDAQRWLAALSKSWEEISKAKERLAIQEWPEVQRLTLKARLKPMAELYQTL